MAPNDTTPDAGIQEAARHLAEGRAADAAAVLERLVEDFPVYVTAHVLLAKAYEASHRPDDALRAWHDAYFLMPGSPLIARERARLLCGEAEPARLEPAPAEVSAPAFAPAARPLRTPALPEGVEDLDTLIEQLENAPRIRPDTAVSDDFADPDEADASEMVSETLARIYETQRQFGEAARAYEQLAQRHPARADEFRQRAEALRQRAREEGLE